LPLQIKTYHLLSKRQQERSTCGRVFESRPLLFSHAEVQSAED